LRVLGIAGSDAILTLATGFTNNGLIELTSAGAAAAATLTVLGGPFTNAAGGQINILTGAGGSRTLNAGLYNQRTLTVSQTATWNEPQPSANSGTINSTGGDLTVNQTGLAPAFSNSGTLIVAAGRTFALVGGVLSNFSRGTLTGGTYQLAGTFQFAGAAITTN